MNNKSKVKNFKVVILGKSAVGKSSVLIRFTDDRFSKDYITTIGVDFKFRSFKLTNQNYKLQIWDTAGQERYQVPAPFVICVLASGIYFLCVWSFGIKFMGVLCTLLGFGDWRF